MFFPFYGATVSSVSITRNTDTHINGILLKWKTCGACVASFNQHNFVWRRLCNKQNLRKILQRQCVQRNQDGK